MGIGQLGRVQVEMKVVGWTREEWEQIRLAALSLQASGAFAGTVIVPARAQLYRLERTGHRRFELRLSSEQELADTVKEEARQSEADLGKGGPDAEERQADCVGP